MIQILADIGRMLDSPLMQRAVIIAVLVGLSAPVIGIFRLFFNNSLGILLEQIGFIC